MTETAEKNIVLYGTGVYSGIAFGTPFFIDHPFKDVTQTAIPPEETDQEVQRLKQAIARSKSQLEDIKRKYGQMLERENIIFDAHIFLIEDESLLKEAESFIRREGVNAEYAILQIKEKFQKIFSKMEDPYFRDRANDIGYVANRILRNLMGREETEYYTITEPMIIVSHDLCPSETAKLQKSMVKGFAIEIGGPTSHTAILARTLRIPAVVGVRELAKYVPDCTYMIIDGNDGKVIINPTQKQIEDAKVKLKKLEKLQREFEKLSSIPARTKDGHYIQLKCNIDNIEEVQDMFKYGGEGIGLFRTEYLFINREELPSEDEHFEIYRKLAKAVDPYELTIRTFDLGGDKFLKKSGYPKELNPFLGVRGVRLSLKYPDLFLTQLRAILRASAYGRIKILFPLIANLDEVKKVKDYVYLAKEQLREEGKDFDANIPIGLMIELPAAVMIAGILAKEVNFFSIGTNDLIQYSLGIDRVNEEVSYLYQPMHPAIIRMIERTLLMGQRNRIDVSLCGEMSSDPLGIVVLAALGFKDLSMNPSFVPIAKTIIRHLTRESCDTLMEQVKAQSTAQDINSLVMGFIESKIPSIINIIPHAQ